jgi:DNA modification methylase
VIHTAALKAGLKPLNLAVWNKGSGGMGSYLRSAHELIPIFCKGDKLAVNNVELGKHGRYRSNVWNYAGANQRGSSAAEVLAEHPTPKNLSMVEDALLDVIDRGAIVLDPFLGSGTTLLAAELSGRCARTIELDPGYVDVAIRRWETMTGQPAVHLATGLAYRELAAKREIGDCGQD